MQVSLACLSADGTALASVEARSEAELRQHSALKLWRLSEGEWVLAARVPQPHQGRVTGLTFHPRLLLVASAATDAKFKLWEGLLSSTHADAKVAGAGTAGAGVDDGTTILHGSESSNVRWACRSVGYYRQTAATAVAFSADGTLLAVAYAPDVVTLWDPLTNELLHSLCQPLASPADELC